MDLSPHDVLGEGIMWAEREISDSSSVGKRLSLEGFESPNKRHSRGVPMQFYRRLWHTLEGRHEFTDQTQTYKASGSTELTKRSHLGSTNHPRSTTHVVLGDITGYSKLDFSVNIKRSTTSASHPLLDRFSLQSAPIHSTYQQPEQEPESEPEPEPEHQPQPQSRTPPQLRAPQPTTKPLISTEQLLSNRQRTSHRALTKFDELSKHYSTSISTGTSPLSLGSVSKRRHSLTLYSESDGDDTSFRSRDTPNYTQKHRPRDYAIDLVDSSARLSSEDSLKDYKIKEESVEYDPQFKRESVLQTQSFFDQPADINRKISVKLEPDARIKSEDARQDVDDDIELTAKGLHAPLELLRSDDQITSKQTISINTAGPNDRSPIVSREISKQLTFPDIFEPSTPDDNDPLLRPPPFQPSKIPDLESTSSSNRSDQNISFQSNLDPIVENTTPPDSDDSSEHDDESIQIDMPEIDQQISDDQQPDDGIHIDIPAIEPHDELPGEVSPTTFEKELSKQQSIEQGDLSTAKPVSSMPISKSTSEESVSDDDFEEGPNGLTSLFSELTLGRIEKRRVQPDAQVAIATAINKRLVRYSLGNKRANTAFYEAVSQKADEMLTQMMKDLEAIVIHRGGREINVSDAKVLCSRYKTHRPYDPPRTQINEITNYTRAKLPLETVHKFEDAMRENN
ncbi:hypothetical protein DIURU_000225 [Diutina rugosa]|uniref:CENP-T/Histone H4 histone fold domain-containing protein n=1 Tax=Diutina rugosa TaxID=5481 RepID=A0A642UZ68_DIURU|nr:uncharacterized protein DIURU_000225 [Diutina rugosa]KAA8908256.1 hypothetical protein DIURU_000225 [Diutina rugosa]